MCSNEHTSIEHSRYCQTFYSVLMRGSRDQRGTTLTFFVLVDERGNDPNTTESGSSSARQRNAIKMAFCWRADDGPTINAGLVAL